MAAVSAMTSALSPLQTTTNSPPTHNYPKHFGFSAPTKSIRRTNSLRRIQQKSGDSEPTSPDSIYNAERVASDESLPEGFTFQLPPPSIPVQGPARRLSQEQTAVNTPNLLRSLSSRSPPLGFSNWPEPQLDTILEQSSTRSLRQSASAPRLQSSPKRSAQYVKARTSIHSIRPIQSENSPWPRERPHPAEGINRQHSFSTNDLDCLKHFLTSQDAESSSVTLCPSPFNRLAPHTPMFPMRPKHPPPQRPRTPDGLPSFGTKEAQQLRLSPAKQRHRYHMLLSWIRGGHESEENSSPSPNPVTSPVAVPEDTPATDMLQRLFGISRPVAAPSADPHPKASLPPGVTSANSPGILAIADDGTPIRSKFGTRASGHGVGTRNLDHHPIARVDARVDRRTAIQEHVEMIDKACERIHRGSERNHLQQLPQFPTIDNELHRHVVRAQRQRSGAFSGLDPRPTSPGSPPIPPSNSPLQPPASLNRAGVMSTSTYEFPVFSGMQSPASSLRMTEPR